MHLAKGLEFRAVAVMARDDEIIPLQERIETVGDDADLQDVYDTERPSQTETKNIMKSMTLARSTSGSKVDYSVRPGAPSRFHPSVPYRPPSDARARPPR